VERRAALSDGLFAVAMVALVLDLTMPPDVGPNPTGPAWHGDLVPTIPAQLNHVVEPRVVWHGSDGGTARRSNRRIVPTFREFA
jgi:hypothetical protein